ncbi:MAG TPA: sigma-70 family RNA polymerase sigma factor [Gemmatimonadaceae bacterium]|nr:sigma-70 family RNA polymerase sigma factor [Gemmatimonadaceae bacterium]
MSEVAAIWPVPELRLPDAETLDDALERPPLRWPLTIKERDTDEDRAASRRLGAIFRAYYSELHAMVVRYVRTHALAEEIIQDAFLAVWQRRFAWTPEMDLKAYVFQTAHNRALNHIRRDRIEIDWQELVAARREEWGMSQYAVDAHENADVDEMVELVQRAVLSLPPRVQRTIALRLQYHLTNVEIAEVMGVSVKAVERNITRGLKALRLAFRAPD